MKRIIRAYRDLINILFVESPIMVIGTFLSSILNGIIISLFAKMGNMHNYIESRQNGTIDKIKSNG